MAKLLKRTSNSLGKVLDTADNLLSISSDITGIVSDVVSTYREELIQEKELRNTPKYRKLQEQMMLMELEVEMKELQEELATLKPTKS